MYDICRGIAAGVMIGLGALTFMIMAPLGIAYKILGAFLFSLGLLAVCEEGLNLVTGKFGLFYNGTWGLSKIFVIFVANIIGVLIIFCVRWIDAAHIDVINAAQSIIIARDNKMWYQHLISGIGCGICIQTAVNNWKAKGEPWGVILPVMVFILCGFEHCVADSFYYCWSPFAWRHLVQIFEVFCGNLLGAFLIFGLTTNDKMQLYLK